MLAEPAVTLGERSYPISIGTGVLADRQWWRTHCTSRTVAIVTNTVVAPLYLGALAKLLESLDHRVVTIVLDDGEAFKNWHTLDRVFDALLEHRCGRDTTVIALGGGVVGDLAGFAAASYQRGVPFIQVPTTLLAQVDSSVGGKTAINHARGKNMVGAFYQPRAVLIDVTLLSTLPPRELSAGMAEVIKHGAIADPAYLADIEEGLDAALACHPQTLARIIERSVRIKADVVAADEREAGVRAHLNFGHTFGHAIETGLGHGTWLHGEAVGAGMCMAADLSRRLDLLPAADLQRIRKLVARARLPTDAPALPLTQWDALMALDKKVLDDAVRFVLLDGLGRAVIRPVPQAVVAQTIVACTAGATEMDQRESFT